MIHRTRPVAASRKWLRISGGRIRDPPSAPCRMPPRESQIESKTKPPPAETYAVAPGSANATPRYPELVRLLIAALPARGRRTRLAVGGRGFGEQLARDAGLTPARRADTAARRICRTLGRLGFQTSAEVSATES